VAELETAVSLSPGTRCGWHSWGRRTESRSGRKGRHVLHQLEELSRGRFVSPYHIAFVLRASGSRTARWTWLERAYTDRSGPVYSLKGSFLFTTLHTQPRFTALLKQMNLRQRAIR